MENNTTEPQSSLPANRFKGRKTFFVTPDTSLMPESYLEDYLTHGYEAYVISDNHACSFRKKIDLIVSIFPDSIIFFHIDYAADGIKWPSYIRELQQAYNNSIIIGVLYNKRINEAEARELERYYLLDVGIQGGCISLEFKRSRNFALIDKVMFANQAAGRRKTVRAMCDALSNMSFDRIRVHMRTKERLRYKAKILDVSLGHFSCIFTDCPYEIPLYEKVEDIIMLINGIHIRADAVLVMKRENPNSDPLYVFMFTRPDGSSGLQADSAIRLGKKIYQMITNETKKVLHDAFSKAGIEERNETLFL